MIEVFSSLEGETTASTYQNDGVGYMLARSLFNRLVTELDGEVLPASSKVIYYANKHGVVVMTKK